MTLPQRNIQCNLTGNTGRTSDHMNLSGDAVKVTGPAPRSRRRGQAYNPPPYPPVPPFERCPSSAKVPLAPVLSAKAVRPLTSGGGGDDGDGTMNVVVVWSARRPTGHNTIAMIKSYEMYCCREGDPYTDHTAWFKMFEVPAIPSAMCCEMTGFETGRSYYFIVRAIDVYDRRAPFELINVSV